MQTYKDTLKAYLTREGKTQIALANAINKSQAAIHRYAEGERFPDAGTARAIDQHTSGLVPFTTWQAEFMARSGLTESGQSETFSTSSQGKAA